MKTWQIVLAIIVLFCFLLWYRWWNNRRKYETGYTIPVTLSERRYDENRSWGDWLHIWFTPICIAIIIALVFWFTRKNR